MYAYKVKNDAEESVEFGIRSKSRQKKTTTLGIEWDLYSWAVGDTPSSFNKER